MRHALRPYGVGPSGLRGVDRTVVDPPSAAAARQTYRPPVEPVPSMHEDVANSLLGNVLLEEVSIFARKRMDLILKLMAEEWIRKDVRLRAEETGRGVDAD